MKLTFNINEIAALIISVLIGTMAYIFFQKIVKKEKPNLMFMVGVFFINLFVTHSVSEIMKVYKWGEYRSAFLPLIAFMGLYILIWFDKRREKLFDAGAKKMGLDINENKEVTDEQNIEEDETGIK